MRQGDIWMADLNPVKGSEQAGTRPVLIISGNLLNQYAPVVIVCPLTSSLKHYKGNVILSPNLENGLTASSEVMVYHVRSITKDRLFHRLGSVNQEVVTQLHGSLRDLLEL